MDTNSTLVLDSFTVNRGAGPVISDVSLTVTPGEIITVVGSNGSGKTSLIEAISGVIPHSNGHIALDGERIDKLSRVSRARRGIVHIEQGRTVFPSLTVRENLTLTAHTRNDFDAALAMFPELEKRISSPAGVLSGGEQQMVVLARACAARPRFLLVDEMSLGLAPIVFARLFPLIRTMADSGTGVLLVEQFTGLALKYADEAVVVASGHVTYQGQARDLLASPELLQKAYLGGSAEKPSHSTITQLMAESRQQHDA